MQSEYLTDIPYVTKKITDGIKVRKNLTWSKDGSKIAFSQFYGRTKLLSYPLDAGSFYNYNTLFTINDRAQYNRFVTSPDGRYVVFSSANRGYLWSYNIEDRSERILDMDHREVSSPIWSFDSKWIAYDAEIDDRKSVWVISDDGGSMRRVSPADSKDHFYHPSFSPDGLSLVCIKESDSSSSLVILDINDGAMNELSVTDTLKKKEYPLWSPTDSVISYVSYESLYDTVAVRLVTPSGGNPRRLTQNFYYAYLPAWSPDGSRIAFNGSYTKGNRMGLYVINITDGEETRITDPGVIAPSWSSDGNSVVIGKASSFAGIASISLTNLEFTMLTYDGFSTNDEFPNWIENDGKVLFQRNRDLFTIPFEGGDVVRLFEMERRLRNNIEVSSDGTKIIYDYSGDIYIEYINDHRIINLTEYIDESLSQPTWAPDDKRIACRAQNGIKLFLIESERLYEKALVEGQFINPAWSPENPVVGSHVAAESNGKIYIFSLNNLVPQLVIERGREPAWSPDATEIVYVDTYEIFITKIFQELL